MRLKKAVRVVRGKNRKSKWAPAKNYRYDGEYLVEKVRAAFIHHFFPA
jgi:hypothetical protein